MADSTTMMSRESQPGMDNISQLTKNVNALISKQQASTDDIRKAVEEDQNNRKIMLSLLEENLNTTKSVDLFNAFQNKALSDLLSNKPKSAVQENVEVTIKDDEVVNTKDQYLNRKMFVFSTILRSFKDRFISMNEDMKKNIWRFIKWKYICDKTIIK